MRSDQPKQPMKSSHLLFAIGLLVLPAAPVFSVEYMDPSTAGAWNVCWLVRNGYPLTAAISPGTNPMGVFLNESRPLPKQMIKNYQTINEFRTSVKQLSDAQQDQKIASYMKGVARKIPVLCGSSLSPQEVQGLKQASN